MSRVQLYARCDLTTAWYCSWSSDRCLKRRETIEKKTPNKKASSCPVRDGGNAAWHIVSQTGLCGSCWVWTETCFCWNCERAFTQQPTWQNDSSSRCRNNTETQKDVSWNVSGAKSSFHKSAGDVFVLQLWVETKHLARWIAFWLRF